MSRGLGVSSALTLYTLMISAYHSRDKLLMHGVLGIKTLAPLFCTLTATLAGSLVIMAPPVVFAFRPCYNLRYYTIINSETWRRCFYL